MKNTLFKLIGLFWPIAALAGPIEDVFGAGARNKALGGAGVAIAEDYTATFYNPSLLSFCRGSRLSLGYDYVHTGLHATPPAEQLNHYQSMNLGLCLKPLSTVGIGIYTNLSLGPIEFNPKTEDTTPTFVLYGPDLKAFSMIMAVGYAPFPWLTIGAGASLSTSVKLGANLNTSIGAQTPVSAEFPTQISPILGALVGITGVPIPELKLSLVYRSTSYGAIDIVQKTDLYNQPLITINTQGYLAYSPHQLAFGSSYVFDHRLMVSADATLYFWSAYPGRYLEIVTSQASTFAPGKTISQGGNPGFSNILVPRFGLEYEVWDKLKLRAGYSYRSSPVADNSSLLLDAAANRFSLGAGYEFQLYQNIFLITDVFFSADVLRNNRGSVLNMGILIGAEYD
ncbi:MAG: outer membrane protein transport protein [Myxococcaceae bacterium]|nr:outer membrane protein transport protein [Myxococcaceae bacterium]MBH2006451.1 outer membrane protein transport protein [Myxococcaceae bacterium]